MSEILSEIVGDHHSDEEIIAAGFVSWKGHCMNVYRINRNTKEVTASEIFDWNFGGREVC